MLGLITVLMFTVTVTACRETAPESTTEVEVQVDSTEAPVEVVVDSTITIEAETQE